MRKTAGKVIAILAIATLASLALAAGFADQSHFTRAFKRHTGLTPNAYRRSTRRRGSPEA